MKRSLCCLLLLISQMFSSAQAERPNILWIIVDDMSANFSCYGEKLIQTPHVDALAARGTLFRHAYVTAPVCSTCRSAFITGMYQTSIGAHHHRSGRGKQKIHLPQGVRPIPELFQEAGYFTAVCRWPLKSNKGGKTDYNFEWNPKMYDGTTWENSRQDQPFFAQIHTPGGKLRGASLESYQKTFARAKQRFGNSTTPKSVTLPPYYPDDPVLRTDWAAYLDTVRETDQMVGEVIQKLESDGDLQNTVVLFMTDHGISHARGKQFLYDEGLHVPLVIAGPGVKKGAVRNDLVEHIDIAALSLALAGIPIPKKMQAQDILAQDYQPRTAVYAARDRCDETVDHIRSVRTKRFKYIRNYLPERPLLQPNAYKDHKAILIAIRKAGEAGKLNGFQQRLLNAKRSPEELYDLERDPFELTNLALSRSTKHYPDLLRMRKMLSEWESSTNDLGRKAESPTMYESDMQVYLKGIQQKKPERYNEIQANIQLMKHWEGEGK